MKKKLDEDTLEFIKRFKKKYNNLPIKIKPPQAAAQVVLVGVLESEFGFTLSERKSCTLDQIQIDSLKVEANFTSIGKSRGNIDLGENNKGKEEVSSSSQGKES